MNVSIRQQVIAYSRAFYSRAYTEDEPIRYTRTVDGKTVEFYHVGHNSSHDFSLGMDEDGQLYRRAYGEKWAAADWSEEETEPSYEETITRIASLDDAGYLGHF